MFIARRDVRRAIYSLAAVVLLASAYLYHSTVPDFYYAVAVVDKVVDGDTVWVKSIWGYREGIRFKVRLAGINAPEISTPEGVLSARELNHLLGGACVVLAAPRNDYRDRYGRTVAVVLLPRDGYLNVNAFLVHQHLADAVDYGIPPEDLLISRFPVPDTVRSAANTLCNR